MNRALLYQERDCVPHSRNRRGEGGGGGANADRQNAGSGARAFRAVIAASQVGADALGAARRTLCTSHDQDECTAA